MTNKEFKHGNQVKNVGVKCIACSLVVKNPNKYCSRTCYWKSKKGVKHTWGNKIGDKLRGVPKTKEHVKKVVEARMSSYGITWDMPRGESHHNWKGENAMYGTLHDWVMHYLGTPKKCTNCKSTNERRYQWANVSGLYKRDLSDWVRLCVKCHRAMDKNIPRASKLYKKSGKILTIKK